jgi:hypothetical protein
MLLAISHRIQADHGATRPQYIQLDGHPSLLHRHPEIDESSLTRKRSLVQSQYRPPGRISKIEQLEQPPGSHSGSHYGCRTKARAGASGLGLSAVIDRIQGDGSSQDDGEGARSRPPDLITMPVPAWSISAVRGQRGVIVRSVMSLRISVHQGSWQPRQRMGQLMLRCDS